jgi:hypothetical protein
MSNELKFITYHNPGDAPVHFEAGGYKFTVPPHGNAQVPMHLEYVIRRRGLQLKKLGDVDTGNEAEGPRDPVARQWWQRAVAFRDENGKLSSLVRGLEQELGEAKSAIYQHERDKARLQDELAEAERDRDMSRRELIDLKHSRHEVRSGAPGEAERSQSPPDIHGEPVQGPSKAEPPKGKKNG